MWVYFQDGAVCGGSFQSVRNLAGVLKGGGGGEFEGDAIMELYGIASIFRNVRALTLSMDGEIIPN